MKRNRTFVAIVSTATLDLIVMAGMGMTVPSATQDPAFKMRKSRSATAGPEVYTPGTQREEMIRLLYSIDARMAEQNQRLTRMEMALHNLVTASIEE